MRNCTTFICSAWTWTRNEFAQCTLHAKITTHLLSIDVYAYFIFTFYFLSFEHGPCSVLAYMPIFPVCSATCVYNRDALTSINTIHFFLNYLFLLSEFPPFAVSLQNANYVCCVWAAANMILRMRRNSVKCHHRKSLSLLFCSHLSQLKFDILQAESLLWLALEKQINTY